MAESRATSNSEALAVRAGQGDAEAFWQLVGPLERMVFAVSIGILRDPEKAQDAVHDTFVRAFSTMGNLRERAKLPGWLAQMARNIAHEALRREERQDRIAAANPRAAEVVSVPDLLAKDEETRLLQRCLGELPEQHRVVLAMKYANNMGCREIAEALDIGLEAAKSRLFEARRVLRARMQAAGVESPARRAES